MPGTNLTVLVLVSTIGTEFSVVGTILTIMMPMTDTVGAIQCV